MYSYQCVGGLESGGSRGSQLASGCGLVQEGGQGQLQERERESLNLSSAAVEQTCLWLGCLGDGGVGLCGGRGLMGGGGARELSLRAGHQRPPSPAVTLFALVLLFTIEQTFAHHMLQVRNIMCTCYDSYSLFELEVFVLTVRATCAVSQCECTV